MRRALSALGREVDGHRCAGEVWIHRLVPNSHGGVDEPMTITEVKPTCSSRRSSRTRCAYYERMRT